MLFKSKKLDLREVNIIYQIEGSESTFTISHFITDKDEFAISFVKNKYKNVSEYTKQNMLVLSGWKLRMLAKWLTRDFSDWEDDTRFFDPTKSLVLDCNCHSELLATSYNKEDKEIYLEIFNIGAWRWNKKFSSEFYFNANNLSPRSIGESMLKVLKPYEEK